MKLHELSPVEGSKKGSRRIGRGHGSGWGKTAGKGHKGQKARSAEKNLQPAASSASRTVDSSLGSV